MTTMIMIFKVYLFERRLLFPYVKLRKRKMYSMMHRSNVKRLLTLVVQNI